MRPESGTTQVNGTWRNKEKGYQQVCGAYLQKKSV